MTDSSWITRAAVIAILPLVKALFRKLAPKPPAASEKWTYETRQKAEPFPAGVVTGFMWLVGIALGSTFFLLRYWNHLWARMDGPADLRVFETSALWFFLPGLAAIAIPWPFTVWLLRRLGRKDEADNITDESNRKAGMNSYLALKWLSIGLVGPIAFFTLLALPMHMTLADSEVCVGRYARWSPERYRYSDARRAILVEGDRYRDGSFHARRNLYVDFVDGRRLDLNAAGDGGDSVREDVVQLILEKTGLPLEHVQTVQDIAAR